ncbi:hypothetical protein [Nocardioides panacisoli]|uniref:Uncharacterized protein n=1 Tax=Nocardioides panacisoli TaxID=627624 RepID=A0ABP7IC93_9ACTN
MPPSLRLLSLPALLVALAACGDDSDPRRDTGPAPVAPVARDAALAWTVQLESDWSPTDAVAVGGVTVLSTSWEIDEGTDVVAYDEDGEVAWDYGGIYGAALLAMVGDDQVLVCGDDDAVLLSTTDGTVVDEVGPDDERCPVADDDAGIPVDHHDEAYTVSGTELAVSSAGEEYTVALDVSDPEIWGVDAGVVAFDDDTDRVLVYR